FNNLHVHLDGVTGAEVGNVVANGCCINSVELVHDYSSSCHRSETRSGACFFKPKEFYQWRTSTKLDEVLVGTPPWQRPNTHQRTMLPYSKSRCVIGRPPNWRPRRRLRSAPACAAPLAVRA